MSSSGAERTALTRAVVHFTPSSLPVPKFSLTNLGYSPYPRPCHRLQARPTCIPRHSHLRRHERDPPLRVHVRLCAVLL